MNNTPNLSVALLIEDIAKVKQLSKVFRKVGVLAHFYEDLSSFWNGVLESVPSLCVVDVRMMSNRQLNIKNHPLVKSESLPLAFYCPQDCDPLMFSTYEIFNIGTIKDDKYISGQVKAVLKRLNKFYQLETEKKNTAIDNEKLEQHLQKVMESHEDLREKNYFDSKVTGWDEMIESQKSCDDFIHALENLMDEWGEVVEFSYIELSQSRKRLVSAHSFHQKFQSMPSLWPGKKFNEGIEFFAQNMASQVAFDLMGGEIMSLNIKSKFENPEAILFVKVADESMMEMFDWETIERSLSGLYTFFEYKNTTASSAAKAETSPWEMMEVLDEHFYGERSLKDSEKALIDIDFSDLVNASMYRNEDNSKHRFYWKKFYIDFMRRVKAMDEVAPQFSFMGPGHLGVLVDIEKAEKALSQLKAVCFRFPIWRFFENPEVVLTENLKPSVRMLPISNEAYLQYMNSLDTPFNIPSEKLESKIRPRPSVTI